MTVKDNLRFYWYTYLQLHPICELNIQMNASNSCRTADRQKKILYGPWHMFSNNVVCATSKGSDQPAHTRSLIRAFASRLNILGDRTSFGVSKLTRKLHRLVWIYTCQNATLLEITFHSSYTHRTKNKGTLEFYFEVFLLCLKHIQVNNGYGLHVQQQHMHDTCRAYWRRYGVSLLPEYPNYWEGKLP